MNILLVSIGILLTGVIIAGIIVVGKLTSSKTSTTSTTNSGDSGSDGNTSSASSPPFSSGWQGVAITTVVLVVIAGGLLWWSPWDGKKVVTSITIGPPAGCPNCVKINHTCRNGVVTLIPKSTWKKGTTAYFYNFGWEEKVTPPQKKYTSPQRNFRWSAIGPVDLKSWGGSCPDDIWATVVE